MIPGVVLFPCSSTISGHTFLDISRHIYSAYYCFFCDRLPKFEIFPRDHLPKLNYFSASFAKFEIFPRSFPKFEIFSRDCLPKFKLFSVIVCRNQRIFSVIICRNSQPFFSITWRKSRFFFSAIICRNSSSFFPDHFSENRDFFLLDRLLKFVIFRRIFRFMSPCRNQIFFRDCSTKLRDFFSAILFRNSIFFPIVYQFQRFFFTNHLMDHRNHLMDF